MKQILYFLIPISICLTSCFEDKGSYDYANLSAIGIDIPSTIEITQAEDIEIEPTITTDYTEDQLTYEWFFITLGDSSSIDIADYEPISTEKNLKYAPPAKEFGSNYRLVLKVSSNMHDYGTYASASVNIIGRYSRGFFFLKEDENGNSDIDWLNDEDEFEENLLKETHGEAVPGKPKLISPLYLQFFLEGIERNSTNCMGIITDRDLHIYTSRALERVHERQNMTYTPMEEDEVAYRFITRQTDMYLFTSKGFRFTFNGSGSNLHTGRYGPIYGEGGSGMVNYIHKSNSIYYWDDVYHTFYKALATLQKGGTYTTIDSDTDPSTGEKIQTQGLIDYKCITMLNSYPSSREEYIHAFLEDATGQRYDYLIEAVGNYPFAVGRITKRVPLNNNLNFSKAIQYTATCYTNYLFGLYNNEVYAYYGTQFDPEIQEEKQLVFSGIPKNETITYISNQYWENSKDPINFDLFVVGTQTGDTYKIYMYELNAGLPEGEPVRTAEGKGKLRNICYISTMGFGGDYQRGD